MTDHWKNKLYFGDNLDIMQEHIAAGVYVPKLFPDKTYPRIQILSIEEILNGKQLDYPRVAPEVTFKKAERLSKEDGEQGTLF